MIAEDPYVAHDALELIDVDYDPLPVVISPQAALEPTAPLIRDDKEDQPTTRSTTGKPATRRDREGVRRGGQGRQARHALPALPSGAARVLRLRRRRQPGDGQGDDLHDLAGAARAPHRVRARRRPAGAEHPDHLARHRRRVRQQGPDLPRLRRRHRGVAPARPAGEVDRGPHRQPDLDRLRARLLHGRRARAEGRRDDDGPARQDALRPGLRVRRRAADEVQGRPLPHRHRLVRHPGGARRHRRRVHEQGARGRRVTAARSASPRRRSSSSGSCRRRRTSSGRPRRPAAEELHPAGQVPVHVGDRLRVRLRQLRAGARPGARARRLQGAARGAEAGAGGRAAARDRPRELHRGRRRGPEPPVRHPRDQDVRLGGAARASDGKAILKLGVKSQGQGHETTFAQIVAHELGIPPEDITVQEGDTDNTPYGLGTYASRSTPVAGAATSVAARKVRDKAKKLAAHLLEASEDDLEWSDAGSPSRGAPDRAKTIQEIAFAAYTDHPEGRWRPGSRRRTTTTRRA